MIYVLGTDESGAVREQWPAVDIDSAMEKIAGLLTRDDEDPEIAEEYAWGVWFQAMEFSVDPLSEFGVGRDGHPVRYGLFEP